MESKQIRELRQSKSLTQQQFADLLGVTSVTLSRWENGQVKPSRLGLARLRKLAGAPEFGVADNAGVGSEAQYGPTGSRGQRLDFLGNPKHLQVLVEGERLSYAHQFNPAFATEISRIDPLPHQRYAVYEKMLPLNRLRFLLADDAGAGKTIMSGLYIRESLARRRLRRVLIVPPAGLVGNWNRELRELFGLNFKVATSRDAASANPFLGEDSDLLVVSLDSLRAKRLFGCLREPGVPPYDLVIFDEAHKLSASRDADGTFRRTKRYHLAEAIAGIREVPQEWRLPWSAQNLLLLTATPHMGKAFPYYCLWRLLEPERLSTETSFNQFSAKSKERCFIRRVKEEMVDIEGNPLFPVRLCDTVKYELSQGEISEKTLYDQTTAYINNYYNQAQVLNRQAARFAMMIFQRRLASSTWSLLCTLRNRQSKLDQLIEGINSGDFLEHELRRRQDILEKKANEGSLKDVLTSTTAEEESVIDGKEEHEINEEEALGAFLATNLAELMEERKQVLSLVGLAESVHQSGNESKFDRMSALLKSAEYQDEKVIIYTEHKDTLDFLVRRLEGMGHAGQVSCIHGGFDYRKRDEEVERFRRPHGTGGDGARFFVGTDAAAEGINLQFCWILINYDIPWNPARLEQRMGRIHRYGQKRDKVGILNLVAANTREGKVVATLLEKLEEIRKQLGSDKVFDVIGRIFDEMDLNAYMREAVRSDGDADRNAANLAGELSIEQVRAIREQEKTIYGNGGDIKSMLPELRQTLEVEELRQLLPGYIRLYLENALPILEIDMLPDSQGCFYLRPRTKAIRQYLLPALERYPARPRFTLHRPKVNGEAVFIHPGEPFFDRLRNRAKMMCAESGQRGAIFTDVNSRVPYLLHIARLTVERKASAGLPKFHIGNVVEQSLMAVKQLPDGKLDEVSVEQILLFKPETRASHDSVALIAESGTLREKVKQHIERELITQRVEIHRTAASRRNEENEIQLCRAFDYRDSELAASRSRLTKRAREGDRKAREQLEGVKAQQRSHRDQRTLALEEARAEIGLIEPGEVEIIATALVQPSRDDADIKALELNSERYAMELVTAHETARGATVIDVSTPPKSRLAGLTDDPGFDLLSTHTGDKRCIEVKGRVGTGGVELTSNEWSKACNLRDRYWLYCVFDCGTASPKLLKVRNPFEKLVAKAQGGVAITYGAVARASEPAA